MAVVYVVYLDSVFFLNSVMDYLLFLTTATLAGVPLRRKRYILAAILGGMYAVAVFLPGFRGLESLSAKLATGILLTLIAFGSEERFWRLLVITFAVACAMAGSVLGLSLLSGSPIPMAGGIFYTDIDAATLLLAAGSAWLVVQLAFRAAARHGLQEQLLDVRVCIDGKFQQFTALRDSGNGLKDPMDSRPVLVIAPGVMELLLPNNTAGLLTQGALNTPADLLEPLMIAAPELCPRLLPYRAVGKKGLLLALRCQWAEIGKKRYEGLTIALAPNSLGDGYSALWGGDGRKDGAHETLVEETKSVV